MSLTDDLYKEIILEHSQKPSHRTPLERSNISEEGVNRSCGDEIEMKLLVEEGVIKGIYVSGKGCSISTASSSLMAQSVDGMKIEEARELISRFKKMLTDEDAESLPEDFEDLESLKGVQKFPVRVKCATLAWNTLEQALTDV